MQIDDVQVVLADDRTKEFGVITHDVGGKVKRALGDELRLLFELVMGHPDVQSGQIDVAEKEARKVCCARSLWAYPNGSAA